MKIRKSARIVVINPVGAVLLLRYHDIRSVDPRWPELHAYWVTPGGGVEEGETFESAAIRELEEETGIERSEVGPQIWSREVDLLDNGELKRHVERYFVVRCEAPRILRNRTKEKIEEMRWWTLNEMRASTEIFLPQGFAGLVEPIIVGELPRGPVTVL
ncbi:MAG TPA: NUDIX domain-containing protein [Candidatus Eisenbacteria bacterium]|jgi:8-oxo-dGTP pyrophosphatase MutT (NUDIX family)|nr:NUDIX domain-containing protein [Candidatus Eisenbacteria bacterium]